MGWAYLSSGPAKWSDFNQPQLEFEQGHKDIVDYTP